MKTNQGDIVLRHSNKYNTRDEILQEIPQEYKGCRGCEFWQACRGGCPTTAIDNDWRNRSYFCPTHKVLLGFYTNITKALKIPKTQPSGQGSNKGKPGHTDSHSNTPHVDTRQHTDVIKQERNYPSYVDKPPDRRQ
jgi:hypothetical protein